MEAALDHDSTKTSDDRSSFSSEVDTDVEDRVEVGLETRKPRHQYSGTTLPSLTNAVNGNEEPSENTEYLHKYGGAIEDLNIQKIMNSVNQYDMNSNGLTQTSNKTNREVIIEAKSDQIQEEIMEEEVVELEFENAIPKLSTHKMHCPNCDHHITKVVLRRRKIINCQRPISEESREPLDLLGCFSCFSLFTSSDCGGFNPFPIFGNKLNSSAVPHADETNVTEDGNCFSIFRVFRKDRYSKQLKPEMVGQHSSQPNPGQVDQDSQQQQVDQDSEKSKPGEVVLPTPPITINDYFLKLPVQQGNVDHEPEHSKPEKADHPPIKELDAFLKLPIRRGNFDQESEHTKPGKTDHPPVKELDAFIKLPMRQGQNHGPIVGGGPAKLENQLPVGGVPSHYDQVPLHESSIDILPANSTETQDPPPARIAGQDSTSFEILKSIVYGGLMEVIASLSIVASASAGDATTLNIMVLALANLIGGIIVIGHNLWDLKDDCYKFSNQQTNNQEPRNKYRELLGSVEHFPLHAFFAILSFLVFGIIPPVTYGYAFHETGDKDFTMVIVAVASFVCVGLLAIFKAYINRSTGFSGYVKTITYYLTTAVAVSGVSYAVGNLVKRLIEELGLFETSSNAGFNVLTNIMSTQTSLAYY